MGKYKVLKKLGQGSYGTVFLVQDSKDGRLFVMKKIGVSGMSPNEVVDCKREIQILSMLKHPNIIGYQRSFVRHGALCIVMDYADDGDLHRMIHKQRKIVKAGGPGIPEAKVLDLLTQVALGLRHIHQQKILHRDLKTQNIFLTKEGGVRLGDFGISRVMASTMDQAKTLVGTPYYLSPEMVNGMPYDSKTDMWSLGVVLYEMLTLEHPFNADNLQMLALRIIQGNYPPIPTSYSMEINGLLSSLLEQDASVRMSIDQCLQHPLIASRISRYSSEPVAATPIRATDPPISAAGNEAATSLSSSVMEVTARPAASPKPYEPRRSAVIGNYEAGTPIRRPSAHAPARAAPSHRQPVPSSDPYAAAYDRGVQERYHQPPLAPRATAPVLCDSSTYQSDIRRSINQRSMSSDIPDTTMDKEQEPDWSNVKCPQRKAIPTAPIAAKPQARNLSSEAASSRQYQIGVLRSHLQTKLGDRILTSLMEVLKSSEKDHIKNVSVKKLIGANHEVLPIVHTLLYLEQR